MLRLCSDSSRPYPGRSVRTAVSNAWDCALHGNMPGTGQKSAKAIVGVGRRPPCDWTAGNKPGKHPGSLTPPKGRTKNRGGAPMSFHDIENPSGGMPMERVIDQPTPEQHLLEQILSRENMEQAWKRVRANKGAPGVDGITIEQFPDQTRSHWKTIRESLMTGSYLPLPVKRVEIPKPTGGTRPLGIPTVLDRLIQQSIAQVLTPIFDPDFSESSFGFRPRRSAKDAVRQVREYIRQGYRIAVDIDLAKFFDTVNHDLLMHLVSKKVHDKRVLALIGRYLRASVPVTG